MGSTVLEKIEEVGCSKHGVEFWRPVKDAAFVVPLRNYQLLRR
jgi:hypothetical protein